MASNRTRPQADSERGHDALLSPSPICPFVCRSSHTPLTAHTPLMYMPSNLSIPPLHSHRLNHNHSFHLSLMQRGWSLDPDHWHAAMSKVAGEWHKCLLRMLDRDSVPLTPGVYMICVRPPLGHSNIFDLLFNSVYVGKAEKRLRDRFKDHCTTPKPDIRKAKKCFGHQHLQFWFLQLEPELVSDAESALIRCLGPTANLISGTTPTIRAIARNPIPLSKHHQGDRGGN